MARPFLSSSLVPSARIAERKKFVLDVVSVVLILIILVSCFRFHIDGVKNWWRRRVAAARYNRLKKSDVEMLKASFKRDTHVTCSIDLGGYQSHTIDASVSQLEKTSELCAWTRRGESPCIPQWRSDVIAVL